MSKSPYGSTVFIALSFGGISLATITLWVMCTPTLHAPEGTLLMAGLLLLAGGITVLAVSRFIPGLLVPFGAGLLGWGGICAILLSSGPPVSQAGLAAVVSAVITGGGVMGAGFLQKAEPPLHSAGEPEKAPFRGSSLQDHVGGVITGLDTRYRITSVDSGIHDLIGYWPEYLIGRVFLHLVPAGERERLAQFLQEPYCDEQRTTGIEVPFTTSHGDLRILSISHCPPGRPGPETDVIWIDLAASPPVTGRDPLISRNEERSPPAPEEMRGGYWDWNLLTGEMYFSLHVREHLGLPPGSDRETIADFRERIHPDDRDSFNEAVRLHLTRKKPYFSTELRVRTLEGRLIWFLTIGRVTLRASDGEPVRMTGVFADVTDRRILGIQLQESEARYRTLTEYARDAIFLLDREFRFRYINPFGAALFRLDQNGVVGKSWDEIAPQVPAHVYTEARSAFLQGRPFSTEFSLLIEGSLVWIDLRLIPVPDTEDKRPVLMGMVRDITERKMNEEAIRQANIKLNLLNSITRHDVVNQLTALVGYLDLSADAARDTRLLELVEKEREIAGMIRTLIQFTRDYQEIGVRSPVWQNVGLAIRNAGRHFHGVPVRIDDSLDSFAIYADPLLEKVFFNLIDNALRHGETIQNIWFSPGEDERGLVITCEDDGTGIPHENKNRIFDKEFGENTGYGLFLTREILGITDLFIQETGEPGRGARFEILAPRGRYRRDRTEPPG